MAEFKIPEINNGIKITQEEWDKFQEDLRIAKFKLQEINDNLEGGLTSRNLASFRNTYVINAQDSLDATYPMYVHFNVLDEMVKIVSVKVDFWILNYRAYATAAASGGSSTPTSSSGGGQTTSSGGGQTTSSGGGQTSSAVGTPSGGGSTSGLLSSIGWAGAQNVGGYVKIQGADYAIFNHAAGAILSQHTHSTPNHTHPNHDHTVANHDHTVANHDHTVANHEHTVTISAHVHSITYGIHEEENSPTIKFYVSENAGTSYSDVFGGYTVDKSAIGITNHITKKGNKLLKFTSTTRTRLSVQITVKLDIKAR